MFKMYDQFLICGVRADRLQIDDDNPNYFIPSVLSNYPSDSEVPNGIEKFCFPDNIKAEEMNEEDVIKSLDPPSEIESMKKHVFMISNHDVFFFNYIG